MEETRTKNAIRNVSTGALVQIINKIMLFVVRTVFIKTLNTEYLGVNGLFTNVLTLLSFAELGIGTAIIYNMYKPVAQRDTEKIKSLMHLYRKSYNVIGIVVFITGLLFIPFMSIIVKDAPNIKENLIYIYVLFLINTSISYFFTYKKSIIYAHQRQSTIDNIDSIFYICKCIFECFFLVMTKNFVVYLCIEIISTLVENLIISVKANKMYPYLKEKNVNKLSKDESRGIFKNVKALVVYKFGGVILTGTDNILISSLINVQMVGLCSNYSLIITAVGNIIFYALGGVTASVGNLNVVGESKQKEKIFYQMTFVNYIVYSFCAIAFMSLLNPFVQIWLGREYVLSLSVSVALAVSFFINGVRNPAYTYRTTLGLFQKAKFTPYIGAIANIILSILLCKIWGVVGIFVATSIAQIVSYSWIDPYLIHKYEFGTSVKRYYAEYVRYAIIFGISATATLSIINICKVDGIIKLVYGAVVVCIIPNIINYIVFRKTEEYIELKEKIIQPYIDKLKKRKRIRKSPKDSMDLYSKD